MEHPSPRFVNVNSPLDQGAATRGQDTILPLNWPWVVIGLGLLVPIMLIVLMVLLPENLPPAAQSLGESQAEFACFVMLTCFAAFALVSETDIRITRMGGRQVEDIRSLLALPAGLSFVLFLIWCAMLAERTALGDTSPLLFVCFVVVSVCVPLLWFTARALQAMRHRMMLFGGFLIATAAVELTLDSGAGNWEERVFTWNSLLIALALALRLGSWGIIQFHETGNPSLRSPSNV